MLARGFPKRCRLTRAREFEQVLRRARHRSGRGPLRIFALANGLSGARLGLVIGKRAVRKAHDRNAVKRMVREAFRLRRARLPAVDVLVQLQGPAGRRELRGWLEELFDELERIARERNELMQGKQAGALAKRIEPARPTVAAWLGQAKRLPDRLRNGIPIIAVRFLQGLVHAHRLLLSPWLGRRCRFHPSCSEYALEVLQRQGPIQGAWLALRRLLKCHPFHPGGVDLPPA